ncbi:MAG: WYL domain-containing protein [Verrucomicrobiales bacterium]
MGNVSNPAQWATMERLRFIERSAFWRAVVNRQDLVETFGLSMAQASADLQKYQEMNPGALIYNLRRKRYEGSEQLAPVCHEPRLEEAMRLFLPDGEKAGKVASLNWIGGRAAGAAKVDVLEMPQRPVSLAVMRRIFVAVLNEQRVRVKYFSVHSSAGEWRWIRPHAFAHDGNRWHVRAWSEENEDFRDFTLSRTSDAEWPVDAEPLKARDKAWLEEVTLVLKATATLDETQRRAIEIDYGMRRGVLRITVRRALENYLRDRLHLPLSDGSIPKRSLELGGRRQGS